MDRFTWGFAGAAIALCVLAIGSVFLVRGTPPPSPKTPAGVVAMYVQAVRDRDSDRAWDLLAPGAATGAVGPPAGSGATSRDIFRQQMANLGQDGSGGRRIRILETSEQGESARVTIEVTTVSAGPAFFDGDHSRTLTFTLKQIDGVWKIDTAPSVFEIG